MRPRSFFGRVLPATANFAAQLDYLRGAGFTTMTAAELSARQATGIGPLPDRPIVLTFDDGYADFHSRAMPLLDRHGFTATLFVTTGWGQDADLRRSAPGRMLTRTQLVEAAAAGVEIAAHTRSHPQLDQLPEHLVREELCTSKRWLEDEIGLAVPGLAYPFGYSSALGRQVAREAGYRYDVSILQAEFSLTQILDRPLSGRMLFEEIIRENLDLGRPDMVQLIFEPRVTRRTPGRFRTRVLTDGVIPSQHIDYKNTRIKQYFKQVPDVREVGARTETTINNTRDFSIGKRLCNLPALRQVGFQANRRVLEVERLSQDCAVGEEAMLKLNRPAEVNGQRAAALRITDLRVLALWHLLVWFRLLPCGFANRDLRAQIAVLTGQEPHHITQGKMTYDLRRLRLHGMIERIPKTHRYRVTDFGFRAALFFTRTHARLYRPGLAEVLPNAPPGDSQLQRHLAKIEAEIDRRIREAKLAA